MSGSTLDRTVGKSDLNGDPVQYLFPLEIVAVKRVEDLFPLAFDR